MVNFIGKILFFITKILLTGMSALLSGFGFDSSFILNSNFVNSPKKTEFDFIEGPTGFLRTMFTIIFVPGFYIYLFVLTYLIFMLPEYMCMIDNYFTGVNDPSSYVYYSFCFKITGIISALTSIIVSFTSFIKKGTIFSHAIKLNRGDNNGLFKMIDNICFELQTMRPDNVILGMGLDFYVTETKVKCMNNELRGRTLCLSSPLIHILSYEELESILYHEIAHFTGSDTFYSKFFYPVYLGLEQAPKIFEKIFDGVLITMFGGRRIAEKILPYLNLFFSTFFDSIILFIVPIYVYNKLFVIIEKFLSRGREKRADLIASSYSSPNVFASALIKIHLSIPAWKEAEQKMYEVIRDGKVYKNMSDLYLYMLSLGEYEYYTILKNEFLKQSHPTDTHPSLKERINIINPSFLNISMDANSNYNLIIKNLSALEEKLTAFKSSI